MPFQLSVQDLLEAGAHYGHQKGRWNPKMRPFIYTERNGVHVINLALTVGFAESAYDKVVEVVSGGQGVLFVGTKPQAREPLKTEAVRCSQHFMVHRWLGGTLTNFRTLKKSVEKIRKYQEMEENGVFQRMTKKEALKVTRERDKLLENLEGIMEMKRLPGAVFVVDVGQDHIAVQEANKLNIPVIALCDTNVDPGHIDFPIPANDDAVRSIRSFAAMIADACIEGEALRQENLRQDEEEAATESLADTFIDADEEEELLTMRKVIKKVKKDGDDEESESANATAADAGSAGDAAVDNDDAGVAEPEGAAESADKSPEANDEQPADAADAENAGDDK